MISTPAFLPSPRRHLTKIRRQQPAFTQLTMLNHSNRSILWLASLVSLWTRALAVDPDTAVGCYVLDNMRHLATKDGCQPHEVTVKGCWGRCATNEVPDLNPPFVSAAHGICAFIAYEENYVELPDCDPGVDPGYIYQSALRCDCTLINSATTNYNYIPDYLSEK